MPKRTAPVNLPAPGRRQPLYVVFDFAETCVFAKQSPEPFPCGPLAGAPLLPRLRGQFAEFLDNQSPERLRMLFPSTCVRLRYGRRAPSLEVFPGSVATRLCGLPASRPPSASCRADLPARRPRGGQRGLPSPLPLRFLRHPVVITAARRSRNINRASIGYASRPRLRTRLTPGGTTLPGNP